MEKKKLGVSVDRHILDKFRDYCSENAYKISGKVELLLKTELKSPKREDRELNSFIGPAKKHGKASPQEMGKIPSSLVSSVLLTQGKPARINPKVTGEGKAPSIDSLRRRKGL